MKELDKAQCASYRLDGTKKHAILLLHGFTASAAAMRPLAEALSGAGYPVSALTLKGHGTTLEDLQYSGWRDWFGDALAEFDALFSEFQHVSVIGHSMGGILALLTAQRRPVWQCVPLVAGLRIQKLSWYWEPLLAPFFPLRPWPEEKDDAKENDAITGYDAYPSAKLWDYLRLAQMARRGLPRVHCPLLCVTAGQDDLVHPANGKLILEGAASKEKKSLLLKDSAHAILSGREKEILYKEVLDFLDE